MTIQTNTWLRRVVALTIFVLVFALWATAPALASDAAPSEAADKTTSMALIYGVITLMSLAMIGVYFALVKKRDAWFVLLYAAIFVVNLGYLALSVSKTLEEALLANRIAYLGSVCLPLCMLMIIVSTCRMKPRRLLVAALICFSVLTFLLAASGGYLPLYYKEVSLVYINGVARLNKIYGPLHFLYLIYLLLYFALMVGAILHALARKKISDPIHAVILAAIVLGNIGVWFLEQLIYVEFEFLSVTYILCGIFLLLLSHLLQVYDRPEPESTPEDTDKDAPPALSRSEQLMAVWPEIRELTSRETEVLNYILDNVKRKDIAERMCVSENTVKKHTSHIFAKLGVSSRGELFARMAAGHDPNT